MRNFSNLLIRKIFTIFLMIIGYICYSQAPKSIIGISSGATNDQLNFTNISENNPTTFSWSFPGGSPSSSTLENPIISYTNPGEYSVSLTVTNNSGSSTSIISFKKTNDNIIDLSTGRNDDGSLMPTTLVIDPDWNVLLPDNSLEPVYTRHTYTGWYNAQIPSDNGLRSVWVSSNIAPIDVIYKSKEFTIPEGRNFFRRYPYYD